ncbi:cytochrome b/b6 domain-containing protein [Pelagibacterium limicola]|uniref:cytochrome b/b6 domain-containing protein n=1 Tax=Pelagibacterium limicola TaxID=2791022 RepID=UPI0018AF6302|nr:cytochrome b/b6 domain-containing protein [Pelagibacterium limicola]
MTAADESGTPGALHPRGELVRRQSAWTRVTHWIWAACLFFLLLSGLQIFNAHPSLYIGQESGFEYNNSVLSIRAERRPDGGIAGITTIWGRTFDTTGVLGFSGSEDEPLGRRVRAFPASVTIPSYQDLATGRVVHFFFGWVLVGTMLVWFIASLINGHLRRDIVPLGADIRGLPGDVASHARFRFPRKRAYSPLQKLAYAVVLLVLFPLIVLTGLAMSPGINAAWPWLIDIFGGRQTARTIHFAVMVLLVGFFVLHVVMVLLAGPINTMRSMITGKYRIDAREGGK